MLLGVSTDMELSAAGAAEPATAEAVRPAAAEPVAETTRRGHLWSERTPAELRSYARRRKRASAELRSKRTLAEPRSHARRSERRLRKLLCLGLRNEVLLGHGVRRFGPRYKGVLSRTLDEPAMRD